MVKRKTGALSAVEHRLSALSTLNEVAIQHLTECCSNGQRFNIHTKLGFVSPSAPPVIVVEGYAARTRMGYDGRRQIVQLFIPGDIIAPIDAVAMPVYTLTHLKACHAPMATSTNALRPIYEKSEQLYHSYLMAHVTRLGLMNARDRLLDGLAELYERSLLSGLVANRVMPLPLTQAQLGEYFGLTAVHVNRTLRDIRNHLGIEWMQREVTMPPGSDMELAAGRNIEAIHAINEPVGRSLNWQARKG